MRARLVDWSRPALELIAPPQCAGCGRIGSSWCRDCRNRTVLLEGRLCPTCGGRLNGDLCPLCAEYEPVFQSAGSFAEYRQPFRNLVIRFKYSPDRMLGGLAADLIHDRAEALIRRLPETDRSSLVIVPVPLGSGRLKQRGYNQVDLFARPLAARLGLPFLPGALRRVKETRSQVGLTPDQRIQNLQSAFRAETGLVAGRAVLLLDDVFTSGATGNACARALHNAGAEAVLVLTLARAVHNQDE